MIAVVLATEEAAVAVKVALDEPAWIVTVLGTDSMALLLDERVTTAPPLGAAPLNVTVPVVDPPATIEVGLNVRPVMVKGFPVEAAVWKKVT